MNKRKYLPTLSELVDRLSIVQLKEVFITEHKEEYAKEIAEITVFSSNRTLRIPSWQNVVFGLS